MLYIRSILEQSSNVWHSSLTIDNEECLERIQKCALKLILKNKYKNYPHACNILNIENLKTRRQKLFEKFTMKNIKHPQFKEYFIEKVNSEYDLREKEKYEIFKARSERFRKSTVLQMQHTANKLYQKVN